ncbi:hypothetical protein AOLI_G00125370 [Acnodon oligacanthus]
MEVVQVLPGGSLLSGFQFHLGMSPILPKQESPSGWSFDPSIPALFALAACPQLHREHSLSSLVLNSHGLCCVLRSAASTLLFLKEATTSCQPQCCTGSKELKAARHNLKAGCGKGFKQLRTTRTKGAPTCTTHTDS